MTNIYYMKQIQIGIIYKSYTQNYTKKTLAKNVHWLVNPMSVILHGYFTQYHAYRKTSNIRHTLVGNKIVDHSDVVGASPVGAAPTISSFSA